jgi:hypothetical protein
VRRSFVVTFLILVPCGVGAQVSQVQPQNPTSVDAIVLCVAAPLTGMPLYSLVRKGSEIRLTFRGWSDTPSGEVHFVSLGQLPAGTYSVIVVFEFTPSENEVERTVTLAPFPLVVTQARAIPTLDPKALLMTALGLSLTAIVGLGRSVVR